MFPRIHLSGEDTLDSIEARLAQAIRSNAKKPGIKPIYTPTAVKKEASRLWSSLNSNKTK